MLQRNRAVRCNICGWTGPRFGGFAHSESATCPWCGAIARDRFLFHCWTSRVEYNPRHRVLETSPRLDDRYREHMRGMVDYLASDFDERAHKADLHLDLQQIDLPDDSIDVILTPHVLEHVPTTERALAEIHRVLKPGGTAMILVPVPQARTAPPVGPEFHGDDTPVFWRFGWDLTDKLKDAGFEVSILVTEELLDRARNGTTWDMAPTEVDPDDLITHAGPYLEDMVVVASRAVTTCLGLEPVYYFIGWEARKRPDPSQTPKATSRTRKPSESSPPSSSDRG